MYIYYEIGLFIGSARLRAFKMAYKAFFYGEWVQSTAFLVPFRVKNCYYTYYTYQKSIVKSIVNFF